MDVDLLTREVEHELLALEALRNQLTGGRRLVFLNACETAVPDDSPDVATLLSQGRADRGDAATQQPPRTRPVPSRCTGLPAAAAHGKTDASRAARSMPGPRVHSGTQDARLLELTVSLTAGLPSTDHPARDGSRSHGARHWLPAVKHR